ncbi:MAG: tRNA 2-thiouridine(34) synthase MnmA [Rhodospirillales bacterium]|nr:tRNA 2-thiouridine(34) synthase MnmA [Rhodospirillales bacterium]
MNSLGLQKPESETRVIVAMSGGVDSSVTAALMADAGYDAVGVTLQLYDHGAALAKKGACCAGQDIRDARRVADAVGIPHYVLDYENRFREEVIDDFADSYLRGETPIPCVRCNQTVKFRDLLATARDLDGDVLVTGHYVRRVDGPHGPELHRAKDESKDQSYFLFATTREQLGFLRFPLGDLDKTQTRALASRFDLPVADKPDSQDICFVPNGNYADLVEKLRPGACDPGDIVHVDGRVLGQHAGIIRYTVGQRRGLGVSSADPLYVVRVEADSRRVIVGPRSALLQSRISVTDINWLGDGALPDEGLAVEIKIRSASVPSAARLFADENGRMLVVPDAPLDSVAPGQACVFYQGDRVLGGGWIVREKQAAQAA